MSLVLQEGEREIVSKAPVQQGLAHTTKSLLNGDYQLFENGEILHFYQYRLFV